MRRSTTKRARLPDVSYLVGIAELGVDVQYLLTGRTSDPGTLALTRDEELLLAGFRELKLRENAGAGAGGCDQWHANGTTGAGKGAG